MKDLVSDRHITVAASVSALLLGWAIFVSPGGSWPGLVAMAALGTLLVASTAWVLIGRLRAPAASMAQLIQDVDAEPMAGPAGRKRGATP